MTPDMDALGQNAAIVDIDRMMSRILDRIELLRERCEMAAEVIPPERLPKDCPCTHHDGPHWLYMDELWRERNRAMMQQSVALAERDPLTALTGFRGYLTEEWSRLVEKGTHLRRLMPTPTPEAQ
jgi:hypothetical protein